MPRRARSVARRSEAGFTLLEMLVVCSLIAILATIALPSLFGDGRRARGSAEAQTMFQDIRNGLEMGFQEQGAYPAGDGEAVLNPATPAPSPQALPKPASWMAAKIRTNLTEVFCGYTWVIGPPGGAVGAEATAFGFVAPADQSWYYILARCDLDGDTVDSFYFTSSVDPTFLKRNEGH